MYLIKRSGVKESIDVDKAIAHITGLCNTEILDSIDIPTFVRTVFKGLVAETTVSTLNQLLAETAESLTTENVHYGLLATRIVVDDIHKTTPLKFSDAIEELYNNKYLKMISDKHYAIVKNNKKMLDDAIIDNNDNNLTFFGLQTLKYSYLLRIHDKIVERPQYLLMRTALGIHCSDLYSVLQTYKLLSNQDIIHATPTLFFSCMCNAQLASCFLLQMDEDSLPGIFKTISDCAQIAKVAGGLGVNIHNIRAKGSFIAGTNGKSSGLRPIIRLFDALTQCVSQGGGKRPSSCAMYLAPYHPDILEFLELRRNTGKEEMRARNLFYGLWISDVFMERVRDDGIWSLMCPNKCPGLDDVWGDEFKTLYEKYEAEGLYNSQLPARSVWYQIIASQVEVGMPYMIYKDSVNRKTNHQNLGTIKGSNLCTEIMQYTSRDEIAVCNLASISLKNCVKTLYNGTQIFSFEKLYNLTEVLVQNLNNVINESYYPVKEAENSNFRNRPIGIGVQGFADACFLLRYPYASPEAKKLNKQIFETIYFAALKASSDLAKVNGPYLSFENSPIANGFLQFDMWEGNITPKLYDWEKLREQIQSYGVYNSLLVAPMPTASTAQILGNTESFEPNTTNIYTRRTMSGEFPVINKYLVQDLQKLNLYDNNMRNEIVKNRGSIANIERIPEDIRELYKTVWEISPRDLIEMAADRGPFIDQSQSMNLYIEEPTYSKLTSVHFFAWSKGLKTGMYYLRQKPACDAIQFTVNKTINVDKKQEDDYINKAFCSIDNNVCMECQ